MAIITTIKTKGNSSTSTLSGNIVIDEGAGELRITKKVGDDIVPVNVINETGNHYYDLNGVERISTGLDDDTGYMRQLYKDATGNSRIIIGQDPADGDQVIAVSTAGNDVEQELGGGANLFGLMATPQPQQPQEEETQEEETTEEEDEEETPEEENA